MPLQSGSHFAIHTPLSLNSILAHLSFGLLLQSLKWSPASCFPSPINTTYCCQNYLPKIQISSCHSPHQTLKRFPDLQKIVFFSYLKRSITPFQACLLRDLFRVCIMPSGHLPPGRTLSTWLSNNLVFSYLSAWMRYIGKHLDLLKPSSSFKTQCKSHLWNDPQNARISSVLFLFYAFTLFSLSAFYYACPYINQAREVILLHSLWSSTIQKNMFAHSSRSKNNSHKLSVLNLQYVNTVLS